MSIQVNSIDVAEVKKKLKECPKIVQDYAKSLENVYELCKEDKSKALKMIKKQAREIRELKRNQKPE